MPLYDSPLNLVKKHKAIEEFLIEYDLIHYALSVLVCLFNQMRYKKNKNKKKKKKEQNESIECTMMIRNLEFFRTINVYLGRLFV